MPRRTNQPRVRLIRVLLTEPEWRELRRLCLAERSDVSSLVRRRVFEQAKHGHANDRCVDHRNGIPEVEDVRSRCRRGVLP